MKKKIVIFLASILIITIAIPVTSTNISKYIKNNPENSKMDDIDWWPMLGHDPQHTGFTTSIAPESNMLKWNYDTGSEIRFSSPVVVNDKLYIGTGEIGTKKLHDFEAIKNKPVLDLFDEKQEKNGIETGGVFCLNIDTGSKEWDFTTRGEVSSTPVVYNGCVYVLSCDADTYEGELYCLNAETGVKQWDSTYSNIITSPTIDGDDLFIEIVDIDTASGKLLCLDPSDGTEKWNHSMGINNLAMYSAPAVYNGKVYYVSFKNTDVNLNCLDASTGQEEWTTFLNTMEMGIGITTPIISDDKVYVMSLEGYYSNQTVRSVLVCVDASNGDEIWRYIMEEFVISLSNPSVHDGIVYFSYVENYWAFGGLACANANTGEIIWDQRLSNDFFTVSQPAISEKKLYISSMNPDLYASYINCFNLINGEKIWTYQLSDVWMVDVSPSIADEKLFAASPYGDIYAFEDELKVTDISGGLVSVKVAIENSGEDNFTDIDWSISVSGGIFDRINISKNNTIQILESQTTDIVRAFPVLGLGKINITVELSMTGINIIKKTKEGLVIGFIVIIP